MSKSLSKLIDEIIEEDSDNRVLILTDRFHIVGTFHSFVGECDSCNDCLITLKKVKIAKIEDLCSCRINECECNLDAFLEYKWFNISVNSIIGFSLLSNEY